MTAPLDGKRVRLVNGQVVILDYQPGTRHRPEHYRTRCHSYRFNMDGTSQLEAKYNITEYLD